MKIRNVRTEDDEKDCVEHKVGGQCFRERHVDRNDQRDGPHEKRGKNGKLLKIIIFVIFIATKDLRTIYGS